MNNHELDGCKQHEGIDGVNSTDAASELAEGAIYTSCQTSCRRLTPASAFERVGSRGSSVPEVRPCSGSRKRVHLVFQGGHSLLQCVML